MKNQKVIGLALVFEKLWKKTGIQKVIHSLLDGRHFEFDVERAVFTTVLHRMMQSGSDRSGMRWLSRNRISGTESLSLHHMYRAMDWLGAPVSEWNADVLRL
ncbi:hypothetical protein JXA40_11865 [bacterium]|nr:hypothetical protein [candidate division CSSED10-310 bacterium]